MSKGGAVENGVIRWMSLPSARIRYRAILAFSRRRNTIHWLSGEYEPTTARCDGSVKWVSSMMSEPSGRIDRMLAGFERSSALIPNAIREPSGDQSCFAQTSHVGEM